MSLSGIILSGLKGLVYITKYWPPLKKLHILKYLKKSKGRVQGKLSMDRGDRWRGDS